MKLAYILVIGGIVTIFGAIIWTDIHHFHDLILMWHYLGSTGRVIMVGGAMVWLGLLVAFLRG